MLSLTSFDLFVKWRDSTPYLPHWARLYINPLILTLKSIFSSLFSLYFLSYELGEFNEKSEHLIIGDHFRYSYDLYG